MHRNRFLRATAWALALYGILGLFVALALLVIGSATFAELARLTGTLDRERGALVESLRTVSRTVGDSAAAMSNVDRSVGEVRTSADTASRLSFETSISFRELAQGLQLQVFGVRPFGGIAPRFTQGADQLEQLAITLGNTRDSLGQNASDVRRVGTDLTQVQRQVDAVADTFDRATALFGAPEQVVPFQVAFYGMCALFALQSLFSLIAGIALTRQLETFGSLSEIVHIHRTSGLGATRVEEAPMRGDLKL